MKDKIKIYFFVFAGIALFGSSVFLWFMIYSDSAKNNLAKKNNIAKECDQSSGKCNIMEGDIADLSKSQQKEMPDFQSDEEISSPVETQESAVEDFSANKVTSTLLDRSLTKSVKSDKEKEEEEDAEKDEADNETKKEDDDKEDEEEEETDDDITVEVGSDD